MTSSSVKIARTSSGVQAMSAAMGDEVAHQVATGQGQVAHQVQRLVPHALVAEAQLVVQGSVLSKTSTF